MYTPLIISIIAIIATMVISAMTDKDTEDTDTINNKEGSYVNLCGPARPEITEELNKLDSAELTFDQIEQLENYVFSGKVISEELRNIAKLPDTTSGLNYAERSRLMDIVSDSLDYYNANEIIRLNKLYKQTGNICYKALAKFLAEPIPYLEEK